MIKKYKFNERLLIHQRLGNDERVEILEYNETLRNDIEMRRIYKMFEKKKLLDFLKSNKISIHDKMDKINEFYKTNIPKPMSISKGGLFKDW